MRIQEHEGTFYIQEDVGINPETTTGKVAARQKFARLPKSRQQRGVIAWRTEQIEQFDPGDFPFFFSWRWMVSYLCTRCVFLFFVCNFFPYPSSKVREANIIFRRRWERLRCASQMEEGQLSSWPWSSRFASTKDILCTHCPFHDKYCSPYASWCKRPVRSFIRFKYVLCSTWIGPLLYRNMLC